MKKPARWALALVLGFVLCFLARLPAGLLARALPAGIALADVEGSLWHGSAGALGINGVLAQEKLRWQFQPKALLHAQLVWQVDGEYAGQAGSLRAVLGLHEQALEQVRLSLPLDPLTRFNPTLAGVRLGGTLNLDSPRLAARAPLTLTARLERVASAMSNEPTLLGNYQVNVTADPTGAGTLQVSNLGGPLQISGGGSFGLARKAVDMKLRLKPEGDLPGLASLLATLPREGDQFVVTFKRP